MSGQGVYILLYMEWGAHDNFLIKVEVYETQINYGCEDWLEQVEDWGSEVR